MPKKGMAFISFLFFNWIRIFCFATRIASFTSKFFVGLLFRVVFSLSTWTSWMLTLCLCRWTWQIQLGLLWGRSENGQRTRELGPRPFRGRKWRSPNRRF
jgi:hypothetical protein